MTAALVAAVVGSGIQATGLTFDAGTQLPAISLAAVFGLGLARAGRAHLAPLPVASSIGAAYRSIGAAYWSTSSTSFADPAVTGGQQPAAPAPSAEESALAR